MLAHVRVPLCDAELAADALWQAGASAVEERENGDGWVTLVADAVPGAAPPGWWVETMDEVDLAVVDTWRAHAEAVRAGTRIVVQPPWVARPVGLRRDDLVIEIDPGLAFGSGSHPTTRLVLAVLERLVRPGCSVLDVGCGSGVLAIAAARLGAARVVAIDVEPAAIAAALDNAHRNRARDRVHVSQQPLGAVEGRFDVVVANIGVATVTELAPALAARAPLLVLSGFLAGRWEPVRQAFPGFAVDEVVEEEGWVVLVLRAGW